MRWLGLIEPLTQVAGPHHVIKQSGVAGPHQAIRCGWASSDPRLAQSRPIQVAAPHRARWLDHASRRLASIGSSSQVKSSQVKSSQDESSQVKSSQDESSQAKSSQDESSQAKSSQVESSRVESSRVESSQVKSSQGKSSQAKSSQVKLRRVKQSQSEAKARQVKSSHPTRPLACNAIAALGLLGAWVRWKSKSRYSGPNKPLFL